MEDIKYLTVTELNKIIKYKFDNSAFFNRVFIKGEISNFKVQMPSGHCYFTIKDEGSRLSAIMFRGTASRVGTNFKDGDMVNVIGKISVYEPSGNYQIYIESMEQSGSGDLYKKFLELKDKLYKEGLFDESKKKEIPKFPKKIGIVTASTGAAIRDILTTIKRRYPLCETILFPCLVQGVEAKEDIVKNIKLANTYDIDTLIVGRGGGSIEDLWAFNEEIVARAIYDSKVPVISAVGHEIDFTISDYVADKRAATPTAAAELAVPNVNELLLNIDKCYERCTNSVVSLINRYKEILSKIKKSSILINPVNLYNAKKQMLLIDTKNLNNSINNILTINNMHLFRLKNSYIITNPNMIYEKKLIELKNNINALELLNPLSSLKRGYGIVKKENKCIENIKKIKINDKIDIYLQGGVVKSIVTDIKEEL